MVDQNKGILGQQAMSGDSRVRGQQWKRAASPLFRCGIAFRVLAREGKQVFRWLIGSRETTNLTYELSSINRGHLAAFLSVVTGAPSDEIEGYFKELDTDDELRHHVAEITSRSNARYKSDLAPRYHKRLGWYALVRILKPKLVIETGVDKGLGSVVIASALLRNREDGPQGNYIGTDINPAAGFLLAGKYSEVGKILYGDSIASLGSVEDPIDLFVNDSDHSQDYEMREYLAVHSKLSENAVIVGDNAHVTNKLMEYSRDNGRKFLYWQEMPVDHWYRGAGIGISWKSYGIEPIAPTGSSVRTTG